MRLRQPENAGYLLRREQHSGSLYFSLEALGYLSQNMTVQYMVFSLAIGRNGCSMAE